MLAALFFAIFPRSAYEIAGGFSKAWAIGFVLLSVYVVEQRRWRILVWSMPLAAVAYPVSPVLMGAIVSIGLVPEFFNVRPEAFRGLKFLVIGSVLALIPLLYKYFTPPDFIGEMISAETMRYATLWPRIANTDELQKRGIVLRDLRETFADTLAWMVQAGYLDAARCPKSSRDSAAS